MPTLTVRAVGRDLQLSDRSVRQLLQQGVLPGGKLAGVWRVDLEAFMEWKRETLGTARQHESDGTRYYLEVEK